MLWICKKYDGLVLRQTALVQGSGNFGFEIEQPAEICEVLLVVVVEEYLVEAGEAQHRVVPVEFYPVRYHASPGRRDVDAVQWLAGRFIKINTRLDV